MEKLNPIITLAYESIIISFDDFGNITRLPDEMLQAIQNAGIEVEVFNPVHRYVNRVYFNYRDHRKILVIDGQIGYTGGVNIADEYINEVARFGHWKDVGKRALRFAPEDRWPCVMQQELGDGFEVIEEGLGGRTAFADHNVEMTYNHLNIHVVEKV